ncbi:unnamed protein product [Debaryomyces tyrocola]|nr:unnamed protein product [Debaryomyces tyrocola]
MRQTVILATKLSRMFSLKVQLTPEISIHTYLTIKVRLHCLYHHLLLWFIFASLSAIFHPQFVDSAPVSSRGHHARTDR